MAEFDNPEFDHSILDDPEYENMDDADYDTPDYNDLELGFDPGQTESLRQATGQTQSLRQEMLQTAMDDFYNSLRDKEGHSPVLGRDPSKFVLDDDGQLRLKAHPNVNLTNKRTSKPLALSTIAGKPGGGGIIRDELGFSDWTRHRPNLSAKAVNTLQTVSDTLAETEAAVENVELRDLGQSATDASNAVQHMETALTDQDINEVLKTINDPPLTLREIRGLDKALQTIRGELTNNLAKLTELDKHITLEKRKLEQAEDEFSRRRIAERLRDLEDERSARIEAASASRDALRSQINRMKETINRILNEDTTLAERVRTLFREQGITIASILTAIGMAISTLVVAITGSGSSVVPTPPPPSDKGGTLKEWTKKHLQSLGRVLSKLAGKAAVAIPGIIGSVVSWLLNMLAKSASWLAGNLWAVVLTIGSLLFLTAREFLAN